MDSQHTLHRRKSSKESSADAGGNATVPSETGDGNSNVQPSPSASSVGSVPFPSPNRLAPPPPPPRSRVQSTPVGHHHARSASTTSAHGLSQHPSSPFNPTFGGRSPITLNGSPYAMGPPTSPFRSSFQLGPPPRGHGHARTRSISAFTPASPSPLASSFPVSASANEPLTTISTTPGTNTPSLHVFPVSNSDPENATSNSPTSPIYAGRRHTRLHSRNLSLFFPRPGTLPHSTIAEDGAQELELGREDEEAPVSDMPSAEPSVNWHSSASAGHGNHTNHRSSSLRQPPTPLGVGFSFGGKSAKNASSGNGHGNGHGLPIPPPMVSPSPSSSSASSMTSRRGHHHKHSLSHNFFSFLEPGANGAIINPNEELHTQPTLTPLSPWMKTSHSLPSDVVDQKLTSPTSHRSSSSTSPSPSERSMHNFADDERNANPAAPLVSVGQFVVGSWLWVVGQQVGSLACTGLGYWVVFDALGVAIGKVVPKWLNGKRRKEGELEKIRRPYGNPRLETVLMFAHSVYLMFSAVYVCKETVEHVLLSAGQHATGEKHHHHLHSSAENGVAGIEFPLALIFISLLSLVGTALAYDNHARLVNVTDTRMPPLTTLIRSLLTATKQTYRDPLPITQPALMLSNPYIASPLFFCFAILLVGIWIPPSQHEAYDMILAAIIAVVTFKVAYRACVVLGTVLLQTAPPRGLPSAKMESFLRAMKDLEQHPQVEHLPPPHIWQIAPIVSDPAIALYEKRGREDGNGGKKSDPLVVTIELHVKKELGDDDVLRLTKWAWERCMLALGGDVKKGENDSDGRGEGPEVTVGVVRG